MEVLTTQVGGAGGGGAGGRMRGGRDGNEQGLLPTTHITEGGVVLPNIGMQFGIYVCTYSPSVDCTPVVHMCMCVVYVRCSVRGDHS